MVPLFRWISFLSALSLSVQPFAAWAQELPLVQKEDSVALLDRAREAQQRFEDTHRAQLPMSRERVVAECDEYIGNICLWESEFEWAASVESLALASARDDLMGILDEVGRVIPGDRWILGQRVRYLGDVGRWKEALALAARCTPAADWWCRGLRGYVLHRSGRVEEALQAFSLSFEAMGPEEVRAWKDPSVLLDPEERGWLKDPAGLSPESAADRFWTLADPLFLTPGNEGLSEYFSRRFAITLYEGTALTMGSSWSRGSEELLLRYGFVAGWERAPPGFRDRMGRGVFQHRHPEARELLPPYEALEDPSGLQEGIWTTGTDHSRHAHAPVLAPLVANGSAQTGVLRRGEDLLVVGAYGIPKDTAFQRRRPEAPSPPEFVGMPQDSGGIERPRWEPGVNGFPPDTLAGLFLVADTGDSPPHSAIGSGGNGVLFLRVPPGGYLLSLEQWNPRGRWGARVRMGVRGEAVPPDVPHLSDLLLLDSADDPPESLEEALPRLRSSLVLESKGRVTVGWEVYGLNRRGEPLTFHLSLVREDGNLFRRFIEWVGLTQKDPALTLSWTEAGSTELGPVFRSLDVDLPDLDEGTYRLRVELRVPFRSPVASNRRISIF